MTTNPIFDSIFKSSFKAFPAEYTDRYTPEVARHQGHVTGYNQAIADVLKLFASQPKLTKQSQELLLEIERLEVSDLE